MNLRIIGSIALSAIILSACSAPPAAEQSGAPEAQSAARPHGWVEGATELAEPLVSVVALDSAGTLRSTRLDSLDTAELAAAPGASRIVGDGRFIAALDGGLDIRLIDTGVWTVDHGDHQHYYQAPAADLGPLGVAADSPGTPLFLDSSETLSVLTVGSRVLLLDREGLGRGEVAVIAEARADEGSRAAALPGGVALIESGALRILDSTGAPVGSAPTAHCASPSGGATTRAGAVFTCAGDDLIVSSRIDSAEVGASWSAEALPAPEGASAEWAIGELRGRPGRPQLAGVDAEGAAWLLDVRERTWTRLESETQVLAAAALGDSKDRVVGVDAAGSVLVWAPEGAPTVTAITRSGPLAAAPQNPDLLVTRDRAYLIGADASSVLEVAPADDARLARTIDSPGIIAFTEVGL